LRVWKPVWVPVSVWLRVPVPMRLLHLARGWVWVPVVVPSVRVRKGEPARVLLAVEFRPLRVRKRMRVPVPMRLLHLARGWVYAPVVVPPRVPVWVRGPVLAWLRVPVPMRFLHLARGWLWVPVVVPSVRVWKGEPAWVLRILVLVRMKPLLCFGVVGVLSTV
jgi:hypothetical protein